MLSRFLLGAIVGGIAVYVWGEDLRRLANTKGRHRALRRRGCAPVRAVHRGGAVRHREGPGDLDAPGRAGRGSSGPHSPGPEMSARAVVGSALLASLLAGCAIGTTSAPPSGGRTEAPPSRPAPTTAKKSVDPAQVERLKKAMLPLLAVMNKPREPGQVEGGHHGRPLDQRGERGERGILRHHRAAPEGQRRAAPGGARPRGGPRGPRARRESAGARHRDRNRRDHPRPDHSGRGPGGARSRARSSRAATAATRSTRPIATGWIFSSGSASRRKS